MLGILCIHGEKIPVFVFIMSGHTLASLWCPHVFASISCNNRASTHVFRQKCLNALLIPSTVLHVLELCVFSAVFLQVLRSESDFSVSDEKL